MSISEHFRSLKSSQISEIEALLDQAECRATFWGGRKVSVKGYDGSISLNEIAQKVNIAAYNIPRFFDVPTLDRLKGVKITDKLMSFYKSTDTEIKNTHWFTRLLNFIREYSIFSYTPDFFIREGITDENFRAYGVYEFEKRFGREVDESRRYIFMQHTLYEYKHATGSHGGLVFAKRTAIKAQLQKECEATDLAL